MATPLTFQIRVLKNQIAACLREIAKGVKSFVDRLVCLESQLETLLQNQDKKMEMIWSGTQLSTALPSNYNGVIVYKIPKKGVVVGFRFPFDLKDDLKTFVTAFNGSWDALGSMWYISCKDMAEIGKAINSFRRDSLFSCRFDCIEVAVDNEIPESIKNSLRKWVAPATKRPQIFAELNRNGISYTHQDTVKDADGRDRIFVEFQVSISDEESYAIDVSQYETLLKSLGFKKDGALWEIYA